MVKIFISYRRTDSANATGRIYDRLVGHFGKNNIFKDIEDVPPGVRFSDYIQDSLRQCALLLVVIGREWLEVRADDGTRRLNNPQDRVRQEIEAGLALGLTVVPVLVEGASMPTRASLPESLQTLSQINAIQVRHDPDFSVDMQHFISFVERAFTTRKRSL